MTRFLFSFDEGAMTFPEEDLPEVDRATHDVVHQAQDAGVWVTGGGVLPGQTVSVVNTDGSVSARESAQEKPSIGGFCILEVPSHAEALEWAAKLAVACRCAQEVRELGADADA